MTHGLEASAGRERTFNSVSPGDGRGAFSVSVIVPVYNASAWVGDAVQSALEQPETAEVVLVEDGSSDDSLQLCRDLSRRFERVRVFRHIRPGNHGVAAARNVGVVAATCEYISFLDADDLYLPGRFTGARKRFEEDPSIGGVYDLVENVCTTNSPAARQIMKHKVRGVGAHTPRDALFEAVLVGNTELFLTNGIVLRKELLLKVGLFQAGLKVAEDTTLWLQLAATNALVDSGRWVPVAVRRVHGSNLRLRASTHYPEARSQMYRYLLKWGRKSHLPQKRRMLIATRWMEHELSRRKSKGGLDGIESLGTHAALCLFLCRAVIQEPLLLRVREYYRKWYALLGGARAMRWCRRVVHV